MGPDPDPDPPSLRSWRLGVSFRSTGPPDPAPLGFRSDREPVAEQHLGLDHHDGQRRLAGGLDGGQHATGAR
jgi:hypothetical protein